MESKINTLIISGGGSKMVTAIGAISVLEQKDILKNIVKYAGSSAGSIICVLLNIGLTPDEIEKTVFSQSSHLVKDSFYKIPFNLLFNYGLFNGSKMVKYIETLFVEKGFDSNITFAQLNEKTGKTLVLTGTSLNEMDTFYFNHHTMPDMKVIDALRISISIPLYFTSVEQKIQDKIHVFVDGGLLNNFPMYYFKIVDDTGKYILTSKDLVKEKQLATKKFKYINCSNTIGIMYLENGEIKNVDDFYQGFNIINNISDYFPALLDTVLNKIQEDNFRDPITGAKENFFRNVICIKIPIKISAVDFDLSQEKKDILIKSGEDAANEYFNHVPIVRRLSF